MHEPNEIVAKPIHLPRRRARLLLHHKDTFVGSADCLVGLSANVGHTRVRNRADNAALKDRGRSARLLRREWWDVHVVSQSLLTAQQSQKVRGGMECLEDNVIYCSIGSHIPLRSTLPFSRAFNAFNVTWDSHNEADS